MSLAKQNPLISMNFKENPHKTHTKMFCASNWNVYAFAFLCSYLEYMWLHHALDT